MTSPFLSRLCNFITSGEPPEQDRLSYVRTAFEDTLAVAFAGWAEPVTRKVAANYDAEDMTPIDPAGAPPEAAAMILGTAMHALDFDDVHSISHTHPSAPIVAALVAAVQDDPGLAHRLTSAFAVGLACNMELGRVLGFAHYEKGWHATSTIGPLAAAAALAFLYGLDEEQAAHALALATAQAGGPQRNFGSMAKPLHAGLAAAGGLRAARLARAGLTADGDIFADKGYFDLYGGAELAADPDRAEFDLYGGGISIKLYPCCYNNHRNIALAFEAREALRERGVSLQEIGRVEVEAPYGSFMALRVKHVPWVGSEGKFCGPYVAACALLDGTVGLEHFEDQNVSRPDVRELAERITLMERPKEDGTKMGLVKLTVFDRDGKMVAEEERTAFPGSPEDAPTTEQMEAKVRDCLGYYVRHTGTPVSYEEFQGFVSGLLQPSPSQVEQVSMALGDD